MDGAFFFEIPPAGLTGFRPVVREILDESSEAAEILISSDPNGEGALIAEFVVRDKHRPTHTVHRASKVLSTSDWLGRKYEMTYESEAEIAQFLRDSSIGWVVVDKSIPKTVEAPHHLLLEKAMADQSSGFFKKGIVPVERPSASISGFAVVYKRAAKQ